MNVVQELAARTLLVILAAAVVQDFMYMKISNRLILMGILFSLAFGLTTGGPKQVIYVLANLSFPVIVLYLLYLLGVLGAGDIKLFSIIGGFTNFRLLISCMFFSFVAAAVIAVCKMLYNRNFCGSLLRAGTYFRCQSQSSADGAAIIYDWESLEASLMATSPFRRGKAATCPSPARIER